MGNSVSSEDDENEERVPQNHSHHYHEKTWRRSDPDDSYVQDIESVAFRRNITRSLRESPLGKQRKSAVVSRSGGLVCRSVGSGRNAAAVQIAAVRRDSSRVCAEGRAVGGQAVRGRRQQRLRQRRGAFSTAMAATQGDCAYGGRRRALLCGRGYHVVGYDASSNHRCAQRLGSRSGKTLANTCCPLPLCAPE